MRHDKAELLLRLVLDLQGSADGLTLEDIGSRYSDKPLSRRTAERLRDAVERLVPQLEQANPGEVPKLFAGFEILCYEEVRGVPDWKEALGGALPRLVRMIARKPAGDQ